MIPFSKLEILNPKRESEIQTGRASWYPYYAGFSEKFAHKLISSAKMEFESRVGDPWNGSGTTTAAAAGVGHNAFGCDLNPVMVLAARARMLSKREKSSLMPLAEVVCDIALKNPISPEIAEPLSTWFLPNSSAAIRAIERAIQTVFISASNRFTICSEQHVQGVSDLAAFFYVALFRTTRTFLQKFDATNPTWIKKPATPQGRLRPTASDVFGAFKCQVAEMAHAIDGDSLSKDSDVTIAVGSSAAIPLPNESVDFVLSSPPYCTRIDYAVATQAELAVLGYKIDTDFDQLRRKLIGTSTVPSVAPSQEKNWGKTCTDFLDAVSSHKSKASNGYYLKNHLQYFDSIFRSLGEISRTLRKNGACVLVVQDSYYKDIHNDVPRIIVEMSNHHQLGLAREERFRHQRTMAGVNPDVRKYRTTVDAVESVLCFEKN